MASSFRTLCLLLLVACQTKDEADTADSAAVVGGDIDGDGYGASEDCDDADATINPGVEEDCDGVDNNCDGDVDEGVGEAYYADEDGDGFGDPNISVVTCEPYGDYLPQSGDCDDTDPATYPGADESCDGLDNDCDEAIDEDLTQYPAYVDEDGDGYADANSEATTCTEPGEPIEATDCDDADSAINPGATEICGDGADQNCDEVDPACGGYEGTVTEDAAGAELMGGPGEYAGARVRPAGDMNGDGRDDLLVNLYGWGPSSADFHGAVMVVEGPVTGVVAVADVASANLYGAAESEYAGWDMARGEDLDGDGWPDLAIGAYGRSDATLGVYGGGYVVYGPVAGTASLDSADGVVVPSDRNLSNLGYEISSSPDLTGDGIGDVILGSYGSSTDSFAGAAWVVPGPVEGTLTLASAITISGEHAIDLAGNGLDGVGDVNGDGVGDLVVGAHGDDTAGDAAGKAGVFYGPLESDLSMADADRSLLGEVTDDEFSRNAVNGRGDVDGDGVDDLLVGAMFASPSGTYSGAAFLFAGDATATGGLSASLATARFYGEATYDFVGRAVDLAGDGDGDGLDDVLIAGQGANGAVADAGAAGLFYGPVTGTFNLSDADALFVGADTSEGFGISACGAGDTNGDGLADLLIGAWFNTDNGSAAGAAFLYAGG